MRVYRSIKRAFSGLQSVWHSEPNFRIELACALLVIALMIVLQTSYLDSALLLLLIGIVLILEILNSTWERIIDLLKPRLHHYVGAIKDMLASAVLLASFVSVVIGLLILSQYLF